MLVQSNLMNVTELGSLISEGLLQVGLALDTTHLSIIWNHNKNSQRSPYGHLMEERYLQRISNKHCIGVYIKGYSVKEREELRRDTTNDEVALLIILMWDL